MKTENELLDSGRRLAALKDFGAQLQLRFRAVNNAAASKGVFQPKPSLAGQTATSSEMRVQNWTLAGHDYWSLMKPLPSRLPRFCRREPNVVTGFRRPSQSKAAQGAVTQMASLAVEVTGNRKLERYFRKLGGELLWQNAEYQRLARELHDSVNDYNAAVGMSLDRLSRCTMDPERVPELLPQLLRFKMSSRPQPVQPPLATDSCRNRLFTGPG